MAAPDRASGAANLSERPYHHLRGGGFRNPPGSPRNSARLRDYLKFLLWDMRWKRLPPLPPGLASSTPPDLAGLSENQIAWLGHACFAIKLGGRLVLTDPYLGDVAGPMALGPRRFLPPALRAHELPRLDLIAISHNHYDHVDVAALKAYRWRAETPVVCPLGLAPLFRKLGFIQVVELDWWQDWQLGDLTVTALPAVHFSGRGLFDRNRTLWASLAFASPARKVWFGGDTGYGACFREIGERYGPFDLALIGIGAYTPRVIMEASHATPEEAVQIARDLQARAAVGMHWGSIMLTPEDPFEAPVRFRQAALEQQYGEANAWVMQVGEVRGF
ncbi:MBL fold metallo-hydrolase [Novosphingobium sp.]|uniref:MBL fold metallo-hydrolase n=1 Tax=Novosphingobium sp. TaxID=1874826 RepID=UPI0025F75541|nr:MBL fold metallo-hydrolase [Novosphingobium sp.]MCC6925634.1 MBL fold metallo-hydrolase [Novosphingobium sp.]